MPTMQIERLPEGVIARPYGDVELRGFPGPDQRRRADRYSRRPPASTRAISGRARRSSERFTCSGRPDDLRAGRQPHHRHHPRVQRRRRSRPDRRQRVPHELARRSRGAVRTRPHGAAHPARLGPTAAEAGRARRQLGRVVRRRVDRRGRDRAAGAGSRCTRPPSPGGSTTTGEWTMPTRSRNGGRVGSSAPPTASVTGSTAGSRSPRCPPGHRSRGRCSRGATRGESWVAAGTPVVASLDARPASLDTFQYVERYLGLTDRVGVDLTGLLGDLGETATADGMQLRSARRTRRRSHRSRASGTWPSGRAPHR